MFRARIYAHIGTREMIGDRNLLTLRDQLVITHIQLRADEARLREIRDRLLRTERVLQRAGTAFTRSRALLERLQRSDTSALREAN